MAKKGRKPGSVVAASETREAKFVRLANKRVTNAIRALRLIGNLGAYPHTEEQAVKIEEALYEAYDAAKTALQPRAGKSKGRTFEL